MKPLYIAAAAAFGIFWWRGHKQRLAADAVAAGTADNTGPHTTDFVGTLWQRLAGADLVAPAHPNLGGGAVADPGKVGTASSGLQAGWDGSIGATA